MKNSKMLFVALLALPAAGCQSDDLPPRPAYVSTRHDGMALMASRERHLFREAKGRRPAAR